MATQSVTPPNVPEARARAEADLALFVCAVAKHAAFDLMTGVADAQRQAALQQLQRFAALSSHERKRLLRCAFGTRPDAARCCAKELERLGGVYRVALEACLKGDHASLSLDQAHAFSVPRAVGPSIAIFASRRLHECMHA